MAIKEKINKVYFPVFEYTVEVVITEDIISSRISRENIYGVYDNDGIQPKALHSYNINKNKCSVFYNKSTSISSIVHECVHAIDMMFVFIGASEIDTEIRAYYMAYLVDEICNMLNKK